MVFEWFLVVFGGFWWFLVGFLVVFWWFLVVFDGFWLVFGWFLVGFLLVLGVGFWSKHVNKKQVF